MVVQVQKFEELYENGQQIVQCVNNEEAVRKISSELENFQSRWKTLVENMELQSKKVSRDHSFCDGYLRGKYKIHF